jgi:hypothetical protein
MLIQLPPPQENQVFYTLTTLEAGIVGLREHLMVEGGDPSKVTIAPSLSFLMQHASSGRSILFDLGIKKRLTEYSPTTQATFPIFEPCKADTDVVDSLRSLSLEPKDISHVFISHVHW